MLDRSKLPLCCIQVKASDSPQEDDTMQLFDNKKIIDTLLSNEKFSKILNNTFPAALKDLPIVPLTKDCRANLCNFDNYYTNKVSTDVELCKPCNDESLSLDHLNEVLPQKEIVIIYFHQGIENPYTHYFTMS